MHITPEFPKKQTTPTPHSNSTGRDAQSSLKRQQLVRLELCNVYSPHKDQANTVENAKLIIKNLI